MKKRMRGFTFMEVMVVLLIIGLISAVVGPNIYGMFKKSRQRAAGIQMQEFHRALKWFKLDQGRFPLESEGLSALTNPSPGLPKPDAFPPDGGYLSGPVPLDPWGRDYAYFCPGRNGEAYELVSQGEEPDRADDDLSSPAPESMIR